MSGLRNACLKLCRRKLCKEPFAWLLWMKLKGCGNFKISATLQGWLFDFSDLADLLLFVPRDCTSELNLRDPHLIAKFCKACNLNFLFCCVFSARRGSFVSVCSCINSLPWCIVIRRSLAPGIKICRILFQPINFKLLIEIKWLDCHCKPSCALNIC